MENIPEFYLIFFNNYSLSFEKPLKTTLEFKGGERGRGKAIKEGKQDFFEFWKMNNFLFIKLQLDFD